MAGVPPADPWRRIYLALRANDPSNDLLCPHPKYFSLTRFDEPLALQPPDFGSEVFYAGRDIGSATKAGPIGPCDYIISTPALAQTEKGQALAAVLAGSATLWELVRTPDLVVLKAGRNPKVSR